MSTENASELIEVIKQLNNPFVDMATIIAVIISLIALWISTSEYFNRRSPHLDIVFAGPSGIACIALKNTGETSLIIKHLTICDDFIKSLPSTSNKKLIEGKLLENVTLLPNECQLFNLGAISTANLMQDVEICDLVISCVFSRVGGRREYQIKNKKLDFRGYGNFLVEANIADQLKQTNKLLDRIYQKLK